MTGPCASWATVDDLCSPCAGLYSLDDTLMEEKLLAASQVLYQLSGQQYTGICTDTVRPCTAWGWFDFFGTGISEQAMFRTFGPNGWWMACGCHSYDRCSCRSLPAIQLLDFTQSIEKVIIDGDTLDPSTYELRSNSLVRIDGKTWPCCNEDFLITFTHGVEPPLLGKTAVAVLACELYLACDPAGVSGKEKCRLPRNIQSIARQGVSVIFQTLTTPGQAMRFGLWEVDTFLETFGNDGHPRAAILSPDVDEDLERVP